MWACLFVFFCSPRGHLSISSRLSLLLHSSGVPPCCLLLLHSSGVPLSFNMFYGAQDLLSFLLFSSFSLSPSLSLSLSFSVPSCILSIFLYLLYTGNREKVFLPPFCLYIISLSFPVSFSLCSLSFSLLSFDLPFSLSHTHTHTAPQKLHCIKHTNTNSLMGDQNTQTHTHTHSVPHSVHCMTHSNTHTLIAVGTKHTHTQTHTLPQSFPCMSHTHQQTLTAG